MKLQFITTNNMKKRKQKRRENTICNEKLVYFLWRQCHCFLIKLFVIHNCQLQSNKISAQFFNINFVLFGSLFLQHRGNGIDMNVIPAWREGITGKGIVVTILDDGLETDHPDLQQNFVSILKLYLPLRVPASI